MRFTRGVSVWPVGAAGSGFAEVPVVKDGKVGVTIVKLVRITVDYRQMGIRGRVLECSSLDHSINLSAIG